MQKMKKTRKFTGKQQRPTKFEQKQKKQRDNSNLGSVAGPPNQKNPNQNQRSQNSHNEEYETFKLDLREKNVIRSLMSEDQIDEMDDTQGFRVVETITYHNKEKKEDEEKKRSPTSHVIRFNELMKEKKNFEYFDTKNFEQETLLKDIFRLIFQHGFNICECEVTQASVIAINQVLKMFEKNKGQFLGENDYNLKNKKYFIISQRIHEIAGLSEMSASESNLTGLNPEEILAAFKEGMENEKIVLNSMFSIEASSSFNKNEEFLVYSENNHFLQIRFILDDFLDDDTANYFKTLFGRNSFYIHAYFPKEYPHAIPRVTFWAHESNSDFFAFQNEFLNRSYLFFMEQFENFGIIQFFEYISWLKEQMFYIYQDFVAAEEAAAEAEREEEAAEKKREEEEAKKALEAKKLPKTLKTQKSFEEKKPIQETKKPEPPKIHKPKINSPNFRDYDSIFDYKENFATEKAWIDANRDYKQQIFNKSIKNNNRIAAHLPARTVSVIENVLNTVSNNRVVVLSGETGSGKTTQVPQLIFDDMVMNQERGLECNIVVTQPRRIAATSVAARVAYERNEELGQGVVGYMVQLDSAFNYANTRLSFVTTGVCLRFLESDPNLEKISHLVIDEVHERTAEIDFLLMWLKEKVLKVNKKLKIILMSATIEDQLFFDYFSSSSANLTVGKIHIPGKTFPVETFFLEDYIMKLNLSKILAKKGKNFDLNEFERLKSTMKHKEFLDTVILDNEEKQKYREQMQMQNLQQQGAVDPNNFFQKRILRNPFSLDLETINLELIYEIIDKIFLRETEIAHDIYEKQLIRENNAKNEKNCKPEDKNFHAKPEYQVLQECLSSNSVLIFLPGLAEIQALISLIQQRKGRDSVFCVALHSTLPKAEQDKAFQHPRYGQKKIVCATNIAETSITIDDVSWVIDSGKMKENRFIPGIKMNNLVETWISKANAKQRAGRSGRVKHGVCFRLYTKDQFFNPNIFPDQQMPEIQRISLLDLTLKLVFLTSKLEQNEKASNLYDSKSSNFFDNDLLKLFQSTITPPNEIDVTHSIKQLVEVNALQKIGQKKESSDEFSEEQEAVLSNDDDSRPFEKRTSSSFATTIITYSVSNAMTVKYNNARKIPTKDLELTKFGNYLANISVEVPLGILILFGALFGCLDPVLTIAASFGLTKSPLVSPFNQLEQSKQTHLESFFVPFSDHLTLLRAYKKWEKNCSNAKTPKTPKTPSDDPNYDESVDEYEEEEEGNFHGKTKKSYYYCNDYYLSHTSMIMIQKRKRQLFESVKNLGFFGKNLNERKFLNQHQNNLGMILSCLFCSFYPNILHIEKDRKSLKYFNQEGELVKSETTQISTKFLKIVNKKARAFDMHPSSLVSSFLFSDYLSKDSDLAQKKNKYVPESEKPYDPKERALQDFSFLSKKKFLKSDWNFMLYFEKFKSGKNDKIYVKDITLVQTLFVALFSKNFKYLEDKRVLILDGWLSFKVDKNDAHLLVHMRNKIGEYVDKKIENPTFFDETLTDALADLMSADRNHDLFLTEL